MARVSYTICWLISNLICVDSDSNSCSDREISNFSELAQYDLYLTHPHLKMDILDEWEFLFQVMIHNQAFAILCSGFCKHVTS